MKEKEKYFYNNDLDNIIKEDDANNEHELNKNQSNDSQPVSFKLHKRLTLSNVGMKTQLSGLLFMKAPELINNKVKSSFAYSIIDFFFNSNFNMDRLNSLEFKEINEMKLQKGIPYKQMTKEEKRKYLYDLLELKQKQKELRQKIIDSLIKPGQHKYYIKIGCEAIGITELNNYGEFKYTDKQIQIAKHCISNNLNFPPVSYYENLVDEIDESYDNDLLNGLDHKNLNTLFSAKNTSDIEALLNNDEFSPEKSPSKFRGSVINSSRGTGLKLIRESTKKNTYQNKPKSQFAPTTQKTTMNETRSKSLANKGKISPENRKKYQFTTLLAKNNPLKLKQKATESKNISPSITLYEVNDESEASVTNVTKVKSKIRHIYTQLLNQSTINTFVSRDTKMLEVNRTKNFGEWLEMSKFYFYFDKIITLNNYNKYKNKITLDLTVKSKTSPPVILKDNNNNKKLTETVIHEEEKEDEIFIINKEISVFHLFPKQMILDPTEVINMSTLKTPAANKHYKRLSDRNSLSQGSLLVMFESVISSNITDIYPLLNINIMSLNDKKFCVPNTFKGFFDSFEYSSLDPTEEYFLVLESCFAPNGFYLTIFSDFEIKNISYSYYLTNYRDYKTFTREIEIPEIPMNCYYVIQKFNIILKQTKKITNNLKHIVANNKAFNAPSSSSSDNSLNRMNIQKLTIQNSSASKNASRNNDSFYKTYNDSYNHNEDEILDQGLLIKFKLPESSSLINEFVDIFIKTKINNSNDDVIKEDDNNLIKIMNYEMFDINESCNVCISIKAPGKVIKQTALFEILGNINYEIEFMNIKEQFEIQDKFYLYKNLILFKEQLIIERSLNLTMKLNLFEVEVVNANDDISEIHYSSLFKSISQLDENIALFKLELLDSNGNKVNQWQFKNEITIQDILLINNIPIIDETERKDKRNSIKDNKDNKNNKLDQTKHKSYTLQCSVYCNDELMFQEFKQKLKNVIWITKFFSTDKLIVNKDITKQLNEINEISSWDNTDNQRYIKGKSSRINFLNNLKYESDLKHDYPNENINNLTSSYNQNKTVETEISNKSNITKYHFAKSHIKFINDASHSFEQIELHSYLNDHSAYKNCILNMKIDKKNNHSSISSSTILKSLPKIYQPTYSNTKQNENKHNIKISNLFIKNTDTLGSFGSSINNHNKSQFTLTTVDNNFFNMVKTKISNDIINFKENEIINDELYNTNKFDNKSKIISFYKSYYNKRVNLNTKTQSYNYRRNDINEHIKEEGNKIDNIMRVLDECELLTLQLTVDKINKDSFSCVEKLIEFHIENTSMNKRSNDTLNLKNSNEVYLRSNMIDAIARCNNYFRDHIETLVNVIIEKINNCNKVNSSKNVNSFKNRNSEKDKELVDYLEHILYLINKLIRNMGIEISNN